MIWSLTHSLAVSASPTELHIPEHIHAPTWSRTSREHHPVLPFCTASNASKHGTSISNKQRTLLRTENKVIASTKDQMQHHERSVSHGTTTQDNTTLGCYEQKTLWTRRYENSMLASRILGADSRDMHYVKSLLHLLLGQMSSRCRKRYKMLWLLFFFFFFFAISRKKMNAQYYSHNAILAKRSSTIYSGLKPPTFTALCAQSFVEDNAFNKQAVMNPPKFDRET